MAIVLFLLCLVSGLLGVLALIIAKGSIHEIQGWLLILIAAVFLVGSFVVVAIQDAARRIARAAAAADGNPAPTSVDLGD